MKIIDDIKYWWKSFWASHGTKLIGFGTALVGAIEYIDHATVQLIETSVGTWASKAILIVSGLATAYRGFTNSKNAAPK